WLVCRAPFGNRGHLQDLRRELSRPGSSPPDPGRRTNHRPRRADVSALAEQGKPMASSTPLINRVEPCYPNPLTNADIEGFDRLAELALDLRRTWQDSTDNLWRKLDPALWDLTQNPWVVLQTVSRDRLKQVLADPAFREHVEAHVQRPESEGSLWFEQHH